MQNFTADAGGAMTTEPQQATAGATRKQETSIPAQTASSSENPHWPMNPLPPAGGSLGLSGSEEKNEKVHTTFKLQWGIVA